MQLKVKSKHPSGMTLPEVMISTAISAVLMAGLITGAIALQRSFAASTQFATAQSNQVRAIDCLTRDIQRSLALTFPSASIPVSLTIPAYYAEGVRQDPSRQGSSISYGPNPVVVEYKVENGDLLRVEDGRSEIIAEGISQCTATMDPNGMVTVKVAFSPRFRVPTLSNNIATEMVATAAPKSYLN